MTKYRITQLLPSFIKPYTLVKSGLKVLLHGQGSIIAPNGLWLARQNRSIIVIQCAFLSLVLQPSGC